MIYVMNIHISLKTDSCKGPRNCL